MVSLSARLVAALLALTASGLLLLGGITYIGQRSYEFDRLDDQIRVAPPVAARALGAGENGPDGPPRGRPASGLPPGTYAERRDADGNVDASTVFTYGQEITADPALPEEIPLRRPFTVEGEGDDDTSYRVYAERDPLGRGSRWSRRHCARSTRG